jgi:hypothetical protein
MLQEHDVHVIHGLHTWEVPWGIAMLMRYVWKLQCYITFDNKCPFYTHAPKLTYNTTSLISRTSDSSSIFGWSLRVRDNEVRLYLLIQLCYYYENINLVHIRLKEIQNSTSTLLLEPYDTLQKGTLTETVIPALLTLFRTAICTSALVLFMVFHNSYKQWSILAF